MEVFFQRFPDLCFGIFDQLDDQNLAKSKEVSVTWCNFINAEKLWWIKKIQKYADEDMNEDPDVWKKVIVGTPIEIVKDLATASRQFYQFHQKGRNYSPLHIAAYSGDLQSCMQILTKLKLKDPKCKEGCSPVYWAAKGGKIENYRYLMKNLKNINPACNKGFTCLYVAAFRGYFDICKLIINKLTTRIQQPIMGPHLFT